MDFFLVLCLQKYPEMLVSRIIFSIFENPPYCQVLVDFQGLRRLVSFELLLMVKLLENCEKSCGGQYLIEAGSFLKYLLRS